MTGKRPPEAQATEDLFSASPDATTLRPVIPSAPVSSNVRLVTFGHPAKAPLPGGPGPDSPRRTRRWCSHLETLLAVLRARFEQMGVPKDLADSYARNALIALADYAGGRDFYLPRAVLLKAAIRDAQIRREFTGRNLNELSTKYQLSVPHIRRILKAKSRSTKAAPNS